MLRYRKPGPDAQVTGLAGRKVGELAPGILQRGAQASRLSQHMISERRDAYSFGGSFQDAGIQLSLEAGDALGDGRLGQSETLRGPADVADGRDGQEVVEVANLHRRFLEVMALLFP